MGRQQFMADITAATLKPPDNIADVRRGDDGQILFDYTYGATSALQLMQLELQVTEPAEYPRSHEYWMFVRDGDVDQSIVDTFHHLCTTIRGKAISTALLEIAKSLKRTINVGHASNPINLTSSDDDHIPADNSDPGDDSDWADAGDDHDDDIAFGFEQPTKQPALTSAKKGKATTMSALKLSAILSRIRLDLRQTKQAGFRVGVFGSPEYSGTISVSIRIANLGISEEVLPAWDLKESQYFVLLIKFKNGYRPLEDVEAIKETVRFKLGLCNRYKPNADSAHDAFAEVGEETAKNQKEAALHTDDFTPCFISHSLNDLFLRFFADVVRYRDSYGLQWTGAEELVRDTQGSIGAPNDTEFYSRTSNESTKRALPKIVLDDMMPASSGHAKDCSLPLVAMQFALRHFVTCTDFCLVCHCKSGSTFEALKPYVCNKPLCLFQYMNLGFGPSIEHEVLSQPYVVDLLISFCYHQAAARRLTKFPIGIGLRVPVLPVTSAPPPLPMYYSSFASAAAVPTSQAGQPQTLQASFNNSTGILTFDSANTAEDLGTNLKAGEYVVLKQTKGGRATNVMFHHRIQEVMLPGLQLGPGVTGTMSSEMADYWPTDKSVEVDVYLCNQEFDSLTSEQQTSSLLLYMDLIPPVKEMVAYLGSQQLHLTSSLERWKERLSPTTVNVLRWIIASNRSCIMQVDTLVEKGVSASNTLPREDRVSNMPDWMQFRFAQGAPDKEQRFVSCIESETKGQQYPTIFAWHGSPIANWHSIIREGLHFNQTLHGRAFGDGVYMSPHVATSRGYTGYGRWDATTSSWPNSELGISSAMSLNEVINKPQNFVHQKPHYVVDKLDWIQTRYLFVKTTASHSNYTSPDTVHLPQDPSRAVRNASVVEIPITAIPSSRRPKNMAPIRKRKSIPSGRRDQPIEIDDSLDSDNSNDEDLEYIADESAGSDVESDVEEGVHSGFSFDEIEECHVPLKKARRVSPTGDQPLLLHGALYSPNETDFKPGTLNHASIQALPQPEDATPSSTRTLQQAFGALVKTQKETPNHELGWYINPEQIDNVYQWIIELHSFEQSSALAKDMKATGATSIVLEMRFANDFPFSPPFVRVVRPRFVPFAQGGGGHVTEGGAICMELLTNNGWLPSNSIESVLMQIRLAMTESERPGRLQTRAIRADYGAGEALDAYERACRNHGWKIPDSIHKLRRAEMNASLAR